MSQSYNQNAFRIVIVVVLVLRFESLLEIVKPPFEFSIASFFVARALGRSEYDLPIYKRVRNGTHCGNIRASKNYSTPGAENALQIGGSFNALLL